MKNILAVMGSPRPSSNSTALSETFLEEEHRLSPDTRTVTKRLQGMRIQACNGCDLCKRVKQGCVLKDDMAILYPLVSGADILVFSTPVYWWGSAVS